MQLGLGDRDVDYITAKQDYCVRWDAKDSESGILKNELSICFELNTNDCSVLQSLNAGKKNSICVAGLEFKEGVKYVTKIRTENNVGLSKVLYSNGFVVDTSPPFIGEILFIDRLRTTKEEAKERFTYSQIAVLWNAFWDKESGIRTYYVCLGTQPGQCTIKKITDVGNSTSFTFQDLPLDDGETYFVSIMAENKAGLKSDWGTSDAIVVDKSGNIIIITIIIIIIIIIIIVIIFVVVIIIVIGIVIVIIIIIIIIIIIVFIIIIIIIIIKNY